MSKLFIGGLAWATKEDTLRRKFEEYGVVEEAVIVMDREFNRSRGFGFVRYTNESDAQKAIEETNNSVLDGRVIRVAKALDTGPKGGGGYGRGGQGMRQSYDPHGGYGGPMGYPPQVPQQYGMPNPNMYQPYGRGYPPAYGALPPQGFVPAPAPYGYDQSQGQQQQQQPQQQPQQPQPPQQGRGY